MERQQTQTYLRSSLRSYVLDVIGAFIEDRLDPDWCNVMDKPFDCISKRALEIDHEMMARFDIDMHTTDKYDDFEKISESFLICGGHVMNKNGYNTFFFISHYH